MTIVDAHVHIIGNGSGGTGCWYRRTKRNRMMAGFMIRNFGLPSDALKRNLDQLYVERLLEMIQGSSVDTVVILAQDEVYHDNGKKMEGAGSFYVPNDYVLELARKHNVFLPAVSIHPARPDAMDELERCLSEGAIMMKCLPNCHNIDASNPRYTPFWERMAEAGLPLLAHTGGELALPVVRRELADPRTLKLPLQIGVKVIAAHCGTRNSFFDADYFDAFRDLVQEYPNLYGDNSAFTLPIRGERIPACLEPPVSERMIHGSDLPIPVYSLFSYKRKHIDRESFQRCRRIANALERDYQLKRAMGFGDETFTRIHSLLRTP